MVSYFVGTALFHGEGTLPGMLRVVGFAYVPQVLGIIPCIGAVIGWIWSLATGFVAVRQGLNLDNLRAFLTILVGFLVYVIGSVIIGFFLRADHGHPQHGKGSPQVGNRSKRHSGN